MGLLLVCTPQTWETENCEWSGFLQWVYIGKSGPELKGRTSELQRSCLNHRATPSCWGRQVTIFWGVWMLLGGTAGLLVIVNVSKLWFQREMLWNVQDEIVWKLKTKFWKGTFKYFFIRSRSFLKFLWGKSANVSLVSDWNAAATAGDSYSQSWHETDPSTWAVDKIEANGAVWVEKLGLSYCCWGGIFRYCCCLWLFSTSSSWLSFLYM